MMRTFGRAVAGLLAFSMLVLILALSPAMAQTEGEPAAETTQATPVQTLLDVLKDDAARQTLIEELEAQVAGEIPAEGEPAQTPQPAVPVAEPVSFGGRIGEISQSIAEAAAESVEEVWRQVLAAPALFGSLGRANYGALTGVLAELAVLAAVCYGIYFAGRLITARFRRNAQASAGRSSWLARVATAILLLLANLLLVVFAWGAGYVTAVALLGTAGRIPFHQTLFLNAFLAIEVFQALVRAVLAPARPNLRLVPIDDAMAQVLTNWLRIAATLLAFGQLLLVPVFNRNVSFAAGQAVSVITYVVVLALVVNLVLRLREPVAARLEPLTARSQGAGWRFLAQYWHVPVLVYLLVLFVVVLLWPGEVLLAMLAATGKVLVAVVLGMIVAGLISRMILSGVRLPTNVSTRVPLLESRLNAFVPRALTVLRLLVVAIVAAITLDAVGLFSVSAWLESEFGSRVAQAVITVSIVVLLAFAAWLVLTSWVDYQLQGTASGRAKARERTLLVLFRNAATIVIVVFAAMFALAQVGLDIAPLLASAGVIGLAIGFGAQRLVQDIITGIFIQLEGAIDVGDVVTIGNISGSVERLTIRSAGLRDSNGVYHVVPFSSVTIVSNFMRGFAYAVIDMTVPATEDLELVREAMEEAHKRLLADPDTAPDVVDKALNFMGIEKFDGANMVVRANIKTLPGRQWSVTRAFNGLVKEVFEERYIGKEKPQTVLPPAGEAAGDAEDAIAEEAAREREARKRTRPRKRRAPEIPDSGAD